MATFIALFGWTEQGIHNVKDTAERAATSGTSRVRQCVWWRTVSPIIECAGRVKSH